MITVGTEPVASTAAVRDARIGRKFVGKVVSYKPYGFFVETADGHFGLVHGKNVAGWKWGQRFDRFFKFGSEVEVEVVDVEAETDRMSFACVLPSAPTAAPADEPVDSPKSIPETRQEIAERWVRENPSASQTACGWLKDELEGGPLYGPLTNVLNERFGVPIPVSYWIRRFPEFVCYSGQGDNPSDLPAVALAAKAGDVAYWNRIKRTAGDLSDAAVTRDEDVAAARRSALVLRLESKVFPGSAWIADYMKMSRGLMCGKDVYGAADVAERLAIPLLGQLGWDVSRENAALVRGGGDSFDVRLFGGAAQSGKVSVAVKCASAGVSFASVPGAVEQVLGLYNRLGGENPDARVIWTNGVEWVVFGREILALCIGILADHRGDELVAEMANPEGRSALRRVELPTEATAFGWLEAFADLADLIGR